MYLADLYLRFAGNCKNTTRDQEGAQGRALLEAYCICIQACVGRHYCGRRNQVSDLKPNGV